jgi:hypothetical protein
MAGNSPVHFGRSAGANLPLNSSLRAIALSCHTSARAGGGARPACCKVGLDRPLIPAAFVANLFVRRGSSSDAPTVGDWETCVRRGRAGHEALPEPSRIGGEIFVPPCEVLVLRFSAAPKGPKQKAQGNALWIRSE